jgi:hypothetical protein
LFITKMYSFGRLPAMCHRISYIRNQAIPPDIQEDR